MDFEGSFEKLLEVTLNYTVGDVITAVSGGASGIKLLVVDAMSRLTIGDILGEALVALNRYADSVGMLATLNAIYDENAGKWISTEAYAKLIANLCNIGLYEFVINAKTSGKDYLLSEAILGEIRVGEIIDGYNVYDELTGTWTNKGENVEFGSGLVDVVKKSVYALKLVDILNGTVDFNTVVDGVYMGSLIGYTCAGSVVEGHKHSADCKWLSEQEVFVEGIGAVNVLTEVDALTQQISALNIGDIVSGTLDIVGIVENISLGELMNLAKVTDADNNVTYYNFKKVDGLNVVELDENGYGYLVADLSKPADKLTNSLASILVKDITGGEGIGVIMDKVEALKLGDIFRYEQRADGWYNEGAKVDGLIAKLCDYTLTQIRGDFNAIINDFTLGDVIAINSNSSLLALLKDTKISELETAIQDLYIGEVMGYSVTETGTWFVDDDNDGVCDSGEEVTDDVVKILVSYKISDLNTSFSTKLLDRMKGEVKLSRFIAYSDCDIFKVFTEEEYNELTLTSLSSAFETKLSGSASLDVLVDIGIIEESMLSNARKEKIVSLYNFGKAPEAQKTWEEITMNDFFNIVFNLLDKTPVA